MISCGVDRLFNPLSRFVLEGHRVAQIWEIGKLGKSRDVAGVACVAQAGPYREDRPSYYGTSAQSTLLHITLTSTSGEISYSSIKSPKG